MASPVSQLKIVRGGKAAGCCRTLTLTATTLMKCRLGPMLKRTAHHLVRGLAPHTHIKNLTQSTSSFGSIAWMKQENYCFSKELSMPDD